MKKFLLFVLLLPLLLFTGCTTETPKEDDKEVDTPNVETKIAVVYFSATNNTARVASKIAEQLDVALIEITPKVAYTSEDLNYNNNNCRANIEQNDALARPEILNEIDLSSYDTIFLGYPIWWGKLPKIIYTFCDAHDLTGYTLVPFCTSGGSSISTSAQELKELEPNANHLTGKRLSSNVSDTEISNWLDSLNVK